METIFYRCPICGNIMLKVCGAEVVPHCCGHQMKKLEAGTSDGKTEYHVPVVKCCQEGTITIYVGQAPHPMTDEHYIQFVYLQTEHGGHLRYLNPGDKAAATFHSKDKPTAIYAYCNLHGLWRHTIECPDPANDK